MRIPSLYSYCNDTSAHLITTDVFMNDSTRIQRETLQSIHFHDNTNNTINAETTDTTSTIILIIFVAQLITNPYPECVRLSRNVVIDELHNNNSRTVTMTSARQ